MTASASRDDTLADQRRQRVDTCRKYWFEGRRFNAALMSCRFGRQPLLECLFDQPKRCKGRMLAELTPTLPTLLREIEGQLLWYAAFPLELTAHTNSVVRAAFLQWLITNPLSVKLIHSHGIHVTNLTIDGDLDLHSVTIGFPVVIRDSHFTGGIILTDAETRFMSFEGSTCAYINADQIKIRGGLKLTHRFKAEGRVDLTEARISGDLDCAGGHFNTKHKHKIQALTIDRAAIEGGVFLTNGFAADGEVSLRGAQITGNLDCSAGSFKSLRSRRRKRRRATRGLSAARALGTTPTEHELYALNTSLATVHGDVRLTVSNGQAFHAEGHVLAIGMRVGGDFDCTNGCLRNLTGVPPHAISLDRSIIGGSVFLRNGFSAHGQVRLIGTKIIGDLDCSAGRLNINRNATEHTEPAALEARSAEINDCVNLCGNLLPDGQKQAFETNGWINFDFARIGGDMCVGQDEGNNAKGGAVLNTEHVNIRNAKIEGALRWKDVECKQHVMLSIDNTTVGGFITNTDNKRWPHALSLRNFVYRYISFRDSNDDDCKDVAYQDWLKRHNEFNPQVYEQLATVLSRSGQHTTANEILEDKEEGRRKTMKANCSAGSMSRNGWVMFALRWIWSYVLKISVGHGYRPVNLLGWASAIIMAGAVVFYIGDTNKLIVPTEKYEGTDRCKNSASQWKEALVNKNFVYYPHFNPMIYSFEVFVPLVNFGQRAHWQPDDMGCKDSVVGSWSIFHIHVLRWWSWFEAGLGWIAVTLGAAGLTSIIRKSSANA